MIVELMWAFTTGLAGSLHCLGMCGPLVIAYSLHLRDTSQPEQHTGSGPTRPSALVYYHGAFHGGRIIAYSLTGALAAGLVSLAGPMDSFGQLQGILTLAGGIGMALFGLILLKVLPSFSGSVIKSPSLGGSFLGKTLAALLRSRTMGSRIALGFAAGFLPCMLSWAMVIKAAATGSIVGGFSLMASFGLGTAPALLFTGFFASLFTLKARLAGERLAALSVIAMGLILMWKGVSRLG